MFEVGTRVIVNGTVDNVKFDNKHGVIFFSDKNSESKPLVKFDEKMVKLHDGGGRVPNGYGYYVYVKNMTVEEGYVPPKTIKETDKIKTLRYAENKKIKEKMYKAIDIERVYTLFNAMAKRNAKKPASKSVVDDYIRKYIDAKYDIFRLFGESLYIETEVDENINDKDMEDLIVDLCSRYPKYSMALSMFTPFEFIENKIQNRSSLKLKVPSYVSGMKLSKFLSQYFNDTEFDVELSKVLQNKTVKGKLKISIDPYDYFTCSFGNHNWGSCYSVRDGSWATGIFSMLLDESTVVAYKENGKEFEYNLFGEKFSGNSKQCRKFFFINKDMRCFLEGGSQGSMSDIAINAFKKMLKDAISKRIGKVDWKNDNNRATYFNEHYGYTHFLGESYSVNVPRIDFAKIKQVDVGVKQVTCICCGKESIPNKNNNPNMVCC